MESTKVLTIKAKEMTHPVYLVSKFHSNKKGVTIYFAQDSCKDIWTSEKMKAKIYTDDKLLKMLL